MTDGALPEPTNETLRALGYTGALPERQRVLVHGVQYDVPVPVGRELEQTRAHEEAYRKAVRILHTELDALEMGARIGAASCATCKSTLHHCTHRAQRYADLSMELRIRYHPGGKEIPAEILTAAHLLMVWGESQELKGDWSIYGIGPREPPK